MSNSREYLESLAATKFISEIGEIDEQFIDEVEEECGCGRAAWDIVNPKEVVTASILVAVRRILRKQGGEK